MSGRNWGLKQSHPYEDDAVRSCTSAETQSDFSCHRVSLCYYKAFFFFFWYQASIQGASVYRKGFIKNHAWNTPTSTPPKGTFQLVSSGVSLMMGEDVLRGSLVTGGLSNRCPQRERLVAFLGTMYTKNNHLKNLF